MELNYFDGRLKNVYGILDVCCLIVHEIDVTFSLVMPLIFILDDF